MIGFGRLMEKESLTLQFIQSQLGGCHTIGKREKLSCQIKKE